LKISIIGGGVMGEIITRSILNQQIAKPSEMMVVDINASKRRILKKKYLVGTSKSALKAVLGSDVVILCLKPQGSNQVLTTLKGKIKSDALVISIMAGIKLGSLEAWLNHRNIVRSMPNISSRIGEGMTVWFANKNVQTLHLLLAQMIFQSFGKELRAIDENLIDSATAVSGSGPAYIFYIAEKLIKASIDLGFDAKESLKLIRQTFQGAMDLWDETALSPTTLREMVTSEKGTTDAAIKTFDRLKAGEVLTKGVQAAFKRAKELGNQ